MKKHILPLVISFVTGFSAQAELPTLFACTQVGAGQSFSSLFQVAVNADGKLQKLEVVRKYFGSDRYNHEREEATLKIHSMSVTNSSVTDDRVEAQEIDPITGQIRSSFMAEKTADGLWTLRLVRGGNLGEVITLNYPMASGQCDAMDLLEQLR